LSIEARGQNDQDPGKWTVFFYILAQSARFPVNNKERLPGNSPGRPGNRGCRIFFAWTETFATPSRGRIMETIKNPEKTFWQDIVRASPVATFFHTDAWTEVMAEAFQLEDITCGFVFSDNTRAVLPLLAKKTRFNAAYTRCRSMVPGVYGGVISEKTLTESRHREIEAYLLSRKLTDLVVTGNPLDPNPFFSDRFRKTDKFTHILDLSAGFEPVFAGYSPKARRRSKSGLKKGLEIRPARTPQDIQDYYETYRDSLRRWGDAATRHYAFSLFENLFSKSRSGADLRLWLATLKNKIIGGVLVLYCNRHAVEWHAAFLREHAALSPNNTLRTEIIRDACRRGIERYDFNPSSNLAGVIKFKESFGAKKVFFTQEKWKNRKLFYRLLKNIS